MMNNTFIFLFFILYDSTLRSGNMCECGGLWCLTPLSTISFQLYRGGQFYC